MLPSVMAGSNITGYRYVTELLVAWLLSACAVAGDVRIEFRSVEVVDELELQSLIPPEDLRYPAFNKPGKLLKVTFESSEDLASDPDRQTGGVKFVDTYFCDAPSVLTNAGIPSIYSNGENISRPSESERAETSRESGQRLFYFFLRPKLDTDVAVPAADTARTGQKYYARYNLMTNPADVCFTLRDGSQMLFVRKSKPARVEKEKLTAAFEKEREQGNN